MLIGYPIRSDDGLLSGGSWQSSLPLANLQDRRVKKVARSTNDALASTKFDCDLKEPLPARVLALVAHNLSKKAKVLWRASADPDFGELNPLAPALDQSPWVDGAGTPTVTRVTGPDGVAWSGYLIEDNDGGGVEYRDLIVTFASDGAKDFGVWVKKGTASVSVIRIRDTSAPADRLLATITWSGADPGTPSMSAGSFVSKRAGRNSWWYLRFTTASVTAVNTNRLWLYGATDTASSTGTTLYALPAIDKRNRVTDTDISGGNWTSFGAPTITAILGPFGALDGYTVYDGSGAAALYRYFVPVFAGDGQKAVHIWVKKGSSAISAIRLRDTTAGTDRLLATVTWSGTDPGTPAMTTGAFVGKTEGANGWWLLRLLSTSVTAANTNQLWLYGEDIAPGSATGSTAYALPWVEDAPEAYEDAHASEWMEAYGQVYPGSVNLLAEAQDLGSWTKVSTPLVLFGFRDPFGGQRAWKIEDDNGAAVEEVYWSFPVSSFIQGFGEDGAKAVALYVRKGTTSSCEFGIYDETFGAWRHRVRATFDSAGVPTLATQAGSGTLGTPEDAGGGWWRITFAATGVVASHRHRAQFTPSDQVTTTTGSVYVYEPWVEDAASLTAESVLAAGVPGYSDHKLPQEQLDDDRKLDVVRVLDEDVVAQFWRVEIDDTENADGYVEIGRLVLAQGTEPPTNQAFNAGATIGWETSTSKVELDGGAFHYEERPRRRVCKGVLGLQNSDQAMVRWFDMFVRAGKHRQVFFVYDPDDTTHLQRRSFLATIQELERFAVASASWHDVPIAVVEEL